jgi:translation initiation factor 2 subunit 2
MEYEEMLKRAMKNLPTRSESRFEVPNAIVYVEKRRTTIRNFADLAKTLRREPADLARYMFKALAVPGSINNGELVLQSKVPPSLINQRVREYTKEFVICNECGKPDTSLQKVDNYMFLKCEACGARRSVARV